MDLVVNALLLIVGMVLLIAGAEGLVRGASSLAKRLRIRPIVIGLTVVAFGTSAPELAVNVLAAGGSRADIAFGNIVGSNIFNVLLILGVSGLICPLVVQKNTVWKEIPFALLAAVVLMVMVNGGWLDGAAADSLSRADGLVLLGFFLIFLVYVFGISKAEGAASEEIRQYGLTLTLVLIVAGLAAVTFGAKLVVDAAVAVARQMGVSEKLIAATIIAGGTSLPELATSTVAAWHRNSDIAVGNIVGSNIFNIFFILGLTAVVRPLPYNPELFNVDMAFGIAATAALFVTMFTGKRLKLDRWEAALFLAGYAAYAAYLVWRR